MSSQKTIVLITGCSKGGIGFALCKEFADQGCVVYATARRLESMEELNHDNIHRLHLDVTQDDEVKNVIETIIDEQGQIDILVNNAGGSTSAPIIDVDMTEILRIFETNVFAAIRTAKVVIPHMASRKRGTIVNVGSIGGNIPNPWNGIYCASKAALHSLTEVLYMECTPFNIAVVLLAPGAIKSNIAANQALRGIPAPPDSLYKDYFDSILKKMTIGQEASPMATDVFAQKTVNALLQPKPPRYMSEGTMASWFKLMEWLPRTWLLDYLWTTLGEGPRKAAQNKK